MSIVKNINFNNSIPLPKVKAIKLSPPKKLNLVIKALSANLYINNILISIILYLAKNWEREGLGMSMLHNKNKPNFCLLSKLLTKNN